METAFNLESKCLYLITIFVCVWRNKSIKKWIHRYICQEVHWLKKKKRLKGLPDLIVIVHLFCFVCFSFFIINWTWQTVVSAAPAPVWGRGSQQAARVTASPRRSRGVLDRPPHFPFHHLRVASCPWRKVTTTTLANGSPLMTGKHSPPRHATPHTSLGHPCRVTQHLGPESDL